MRGLIAMAGLVFVVGCGAVADSPEDVRSIAGGLGTIAGEAAGDRDKGAALGKATGEVAYGTAKLSKQLELSRVKTIFYYDGNYMEIVPTGKPSDNCVSVELFHYNLKGELVKREQAMECFMTKGK
ncbi:hypothetical protein IAE16_00560 [Hydrogenobacter sp. T-2]|uniref:hypothetical protein n=1 Tax=Pampinifervens diazotrophicum TaxID=1632018 RepID=UPI002B25C601|nr:hypothetical protein [Hydrogenobacter sp. T-2]WPM32188.1 hypothetical protein IAE16_00560 [Hydrogenobacter sp. T-2]